MRPSVDLNVEFLTGLLVPWCLASTSVYGSVNPTRHSQRRDLINSRTTPSPHRVAGFEARSGAPAPPGIGLGGADLGGCVKRRCADRRSGAP
ncbi:MAG: hypothetical protein KDB86_10730, partial [Actinobacteria bacterium]|nr:hypothetical protein [Actinomycetota bacterium]